jgi:hypothetical protein
LPGFNHVSYHDNGLLSYKAVEVVDFDPSRRFAASEMLAAFPPAPEEMPKRGPLFKSPSALPSSGLDELKRELGARIEAHPTARRNGRGKIDCRGVCHDGKGSTGLFYDVNKNFVWCNAETPCDLSTIMRAFGLEPTAPPPRAGRDRGRL